MKYLICFFLLSFSLIEAQNYQQDYSVFVGLFVGNNSTLPYWLTHNQSGQLDCDSNIFSKGTYKSSYSFDEHVKLDGGLGLLYQNGRLAGLQIDQFYIRFSNKWMQAILGARHPVKEYDDLSSTNGSILWSSNTRAIPGI